MSNTDKSADPAFITLDEVLDGVFELAAIRPGMYRRVDGFASSTCVNTEIVNGKLVGSCIVGSFLADRFGAENVPYTGGAEATLDEMIDKGVIKGIEPEARFALRVAQRLQDTREVSWRIISVNLPGIVDAASDMADSRDLEY